MITITFIYRELNYMGDYIFQRTQNIYVIIFFILQLHIILFFHSHIFVYLLQYLYIKTHIHFNKKASHHFIFINI